MTIPVESLLAVKKIVSHRDCPDGVASALILRDVLPDAEIFFARYGTPETDRMEATPGLLFVDFSPPEARAPQFVKAGAIVLDHHRTAEKVVRSFGELGVYADEPGVSGALLAYREVWKPLAYRGGQRPPHHQTEGRGDRCLEHFATVAGVRDTWQRNSELWRESCAQAEALRFWPWDRWPKDPLVHGFWTDDVVRMLAVGEVLLERNAIEDKKNYDAATGLKTSRGLRAVVVNTRDTSDLAELFPKDIELLVGFTYLAQSDGRIYMNLSIRSRGDFDCGKFAKHFGGGGHKGAAGCTIAVDQGDPNPYAFLAIVLQSWEDHNAPRIQVNF